MKGKEKGKGKIGERGGKRRSCNVKTQCGKDVI